VALCVQPFVRDAARLELGKERLEPERMLVDDRDGPADAGANDARPEVLPRRLPRCAIFRPVETSCVKVRLKPGSLERVRAWAAELNGRRDEVLATLRDEAVVIESVFLDESDDGDFLVYFMKARSLADATRVAQRSTHAIDAYHQEFKRSTWEATTPLEVLIDFENLADL
jgi:uncharacterized protein DUF6176